MKRARGHLTSILVWTLLCGAFFGAVLSGRSQFKAGDLSGQFHAFALFQFRQLLKGEWPLWSPGSYGGFPFLGDVQSAVFYPPRWLTLFVARCLGHLPYDLIEMEAILHVWLAGIFTYAFALDITHKRAPALVSAICFALGGYLTSYPMPQLAILETIAWLPLILWALRRAVQSSYPTRFLVLAAALWAVAALAGHPQTLMQVSYLVAAYYLCLALRARWRFADVLWPGLLVGLLAMGLSAVGWVPALSYWPHTVRGGVSYDFVSGGAQLIHYLQMLLPGAFTLWSAEYVGVAGLALASVCWLRGPAAPAAHQIETRFWTVVLLVGGVLALGDKGLLFAFLHRVLPGMALFRQQERWLALFNLALALLAGLGASAWIEADRATWQRLWSLCRNVLALSLGLAAFGLFMIQGLREAAWPWILARQALGLGLVLVILRADAPGRYRWSALLSVLVVDLFLVWSGASPTERVTSRPFWPQPRWLETVRSQPAYRLDASGTFAVNLGEVYGLEEIGGISPLEPARLVALRQLPRQRYWQLLSVGYVVAREADAADALIPLEEIPAESIPGQKDAAALYEFVHALPRARLAYAPIFVEDESQALERLADPGFDPATQVILQGGGAGSDGASEAFATSPDPAQALTILERDANRYALQVETRTPAYLVLSEWHDPGWKARLDGRPFPILTANYAFQAVFVLPGTHRIELRYAPLYLPIGAGLSCLSLLLASIALALARRWRPQPALQSQLVRRLQALPAMSITLPVKREPWIVLGLCLLAFGLRVFRLGYQELRGDEAFSFIYASYPLREIIPALLSEGDPHSPLHYLAMHLWMRMAGASEFALRFPSALLGVAIIPLGWQIGRRFGGRRLALLLAALLCLSEPLVWVAQDTRNQYSAVVLFSGLATWVLTDPRFRAKALWRVGYALSAALTLYSFYYGAFMLLAHGVYVVLARRDRGLVVAWLWGLGGALVLFAPWLIASASRVMAAGQLTHGSSPRLARFLVSGSAYLLGGAAWPNGVGEWFFALGTPLLVYGIHLARSRMPHGLFLSGIGISVLLTFLMQFRRGTYSDRYLLVMVLPFWFFLGQGLLGLLEGKTLRPLLGCAAVLGLLTINLVGLGRNYFDTGYSRTRGYRPIAARIESSMRPQDVFLRNFPDPCWDYYLRHLNLGDALLPDSPKADLEHTDPLAWELAHRYERIWFVPNLSKAWDPDGTVKHWLDHNLLLEGAWRHVKQELYLYRSPQAVAAVMQPVDVAFENDVMLGAYYVTVEGEAVSPAASGEIRPNQRLQVTLQWRALADMVGNYTVFVQILDEGGRLVGQHDGVPVFGTRPTSTWRSGDEVLDRHDITLPGDAAPGRLQVIVGLYDSATVERVLLKEDRGMDALSLFTLQNRGS
ncbi:MAG: YfhO family protein [Anaerolineae bacterium]|nr:YfhO family protein [Anaerolineae bacterium]